MDISLNINNGNLGAWKLEGLQSNPANIQTSNKPGSQGANLQPSAPEPTTLDPLQGSEPTADIPDAALSRDDDLGKLVNSVFNLPPPPMPSFAS